MVQYGELQIPSLIDKGESGNFENGNIPAEEVKEFKKDRTICILIYLLIFVGIVSRSVISYYAQYNHFLSFYLTVSVLCFVLLSVNLPSKDEILPVKTFAKPGAMFLCFLELCFVAIAFYNAASAEVATAIHANMITSVLLTYFCSHFRIFNYTPLENNGIYRKSRTIYKSCDGIKISDSRSFSIVLENTGTEVLPFTDLSIERLAICAKGRSFIKFKLPEKGTINPGQTITIVPETEKYKDLLSALPVPGFRCFGIDAGEKISTKLANGKKTISLMEEHFEHNSDANNSKGFDCVTEVVNTEEGVKTVEIKC